MHVLNHKTKSIFYLSIYILAIVGSRLKAGGRSPLKDYVWLLLAVFSSYPAALIGPNPNSVLSV